MKKIKGAILLLHHGHQKILRDDVVSTIVDQFGTIDTKAIDIKYYTTIEYSKTNTFNKFIEYSIEHRRIFKEEIKPIIDKNPDYVICYFGFAPIPLIIDFGNLFHNYQQIYVFQRNHKTREWKYSSITSSFKKGDIIISGLPSIEQKGLNEATLRISTSHIVNELNTQDVVNDTVEVDIKLRSADEDSIDSLNKMIQLGEEIKMVIDTLFNNVSRIDKIHLFGSIPCGLAFLIGVKISPTMHRRIQTYHYNASEDIKYKKALVINGINETEQELTVEEKKKAKKLRVVANDILKKEVIPNIELLDTKSHWLFRENKKKIESIESFWLDIPNLKTTSLSADTINTQNLDLGGEFYWRDNSWEIDDRFFVALNNRLKKKEDKTTAIKLFLFHESLHYSYHDLSSEKSVGIGSFAKTLETADYQADVYAIINEYYFSKDNSKTPKEQFKNLIKVATETMWSFDDNGTDLERIQVRRLNRYLIWYFLYVIIEKNGSSLENILKILLDKPVIELNGLTTDEENNRFYFNLEKRKNTPLEIGVFYKNKVKRIGEASNFNISKLVNGVKTKNGNDIIDVLRSFL